MKHLKLFKENKDKEDYYVEVSQTVYSDYFYNIIHISQQNIEYIERLIYNKNFTLNIDLVAIRPTHLINNIRISPTQTANSYENERITISELEDEYFLTNIKFYARTGHFLRELRYKCDQIDGIKELFEDLNII